MCASWEGTVDNVITFDDYPGAIFAPRRLKRIYGEN